MGATPTSIYSALDTAWVASAARNAGSTAVSDTKGVDRYTEAKILVDVTAASGTSPTLNIYLQTLLPDNTTWMDIASFAQIVGTGKKCLDFISAGSSFNTVATKALAAGTILATCLGRSIRMAWTIAGTNPSFTFSVSIILWA